MRYQGKLTSPSYWQIYGAHPPKDPNAPKESTLSWSRNESFGVVAVTADVAIAKIRETYPDFKVWTVQHRGTIDFGIKITIDNPR